MYNEAESKEPLPKLKKCCPLLAECSRGQIEMKLDAVMAVFNENMII